MQPGPLRFASLVAPLALAGCLAPRAVAIARPAAPGGSPPRRSTLEARGTRITVDEEDADLVDVMARIAARAGARLRVDPSVQERVTVLLPDIAWREAVDVIARMCRCEVEERPDGELSLAQPECVRLQVCDCDLRTLFELAGPYAGVDLHVLPGLPARSSDLDLGVRMDELLLRLAREAGALLVLSADGERGVVGPDVVRGRLAGHDDAGLLLELGPSPWRQVGLERLTLSIPAGPDGDALRAQLRHAREGDSIAVRCGAPPEAGELLRAGQPLVARAVVDGR